MATKGSLLQVMSDQTRQQLELSIGMQEHIQGMLHASLALTQDIAGALEQLRGGKRRCVNPSGVGSVVLQPPSALIPQVAARDICIHNAAHMSGNGGLPGDLAPPTSTSSQSARVESPGAAQRTAAGVTLPGVTPAAAPSNAPCLSGSSHVWACSPSSGASMAFGGLAEAGSDGLVRVPSASSSPSAASQLVTSMSMPCSPARGGTRSSNSSFTTSTSSGRMVAKPPRASMFGPGTYPHSPQEQQVQQQQPLPRLPSLPSAPSSLTASVAMPAVAPAFQQPPCGQLLMGASSSGIPPLPPAAAAGVANVSRQQQMICGPAPAAFHGQSISIRNSLVSARSDPAPLLHSCGSGISLAAPASPSPSVSLTSAACSAAPSPRPLPPLPPSQRLSSGAAASSPHSKPAAAAAVVASSKKRRSSSSVMPPAPPAVAAAADRHGHSHHRHPQHHCHHHIVAAAITTTATAAAAAAAAIGGAPSAVATSGLATTAALNPFTFTSGYFSHPSVLAQLQGTGQTVVAPAPAGALGAAAAPACAASAAEAVTAIGPPSPVAAPTAPGSGSCVVPDLDPASAAALMLDLDPKGVDLPAGDGFMFHNCDELLGGAGDPWSQLFQE